MINTLGFTTSIPVEFLFAAGIRPVDLNNIFITSEHARQYVENAEEKGFPGNCCCWIKGLYSVSFIEKLGGIVTVVHGDCSNTVALREVWESDGFYTIPFSFPLSRKSEELKREIEQFASILGTTLEAAEHEKKKIDVIRCKLRELDRMTWEDGTVNGGENHLWLVSASDFFGDYEAFDIKLSDFLHTASGRKPFGKRKRIAYVGVPPIIDGLYEFVEENDGMVVYNEIQRQFSMIDGIGQDIVNTYVQYTYPYGIHARIDDITRQIKERSIDGVIHYTQSFCYRQIEDIVLRRNVSCPVLTVESDRPGKIDEQLKMRIENFMAMV